MTSNHRQGNAMPVFPNAAHFQSQMGMMNPHMVIPANNSNAHLSNGPLPISNVPISSPLGASNHFHHLQNGMPFIGQCHPGFPAQMNPILPPSQLFGHNYINMSQQLNQSAGFSSMQPCFPSPIQNVNQFLPMPLPNCAQVVSCNLSQLPNQLPQVLGPQNPAFLANPQIFMAHSKAVVRPCNQDRPDLVPPTIDASLPRQSHNTTQQLHRKTTLPAAFGSDPQQQTPKGFRLPTIRKSQENTVKDCGSAGSDGLRQNSQDRNFRRNLKRDVLHRGFQKNESKHNVKGKSGYKRGGKGFKNESGRNAGLIASTNDSQAEQRRLLTLKYTKQEIQQWREERRKNYPSKINTQKKLIEKQTGPDVMDKDAKLRRQRLKEILAKQAELGCEVAEIPSYYLSDSEKHMHGEWANKKAPTKRDRFRNKLNRTGQFRNNDRFQKKPRFADNSINVHDNNEESANNDDQTSKLFLNRRQPTLLQRLLSTELKRDRSRLLQVLRFMTMNSFFEHRSEKPLIFPKVIVKETASDSDIVEGNSLCSGEGDSRIRNKVTAQNSHYLNENDGGDDKVCNGDIPDCVGQVKAVCFGSFCGDEAEEEGEIID